MSQGDTIVEVIYQGAVANNRTGKLLSFVVTPASRKSNVVFANCASAW